jgi:class 3 adenylate cyclase
VQDTQPNVETPSSKRQHRKRHFFSLRVKLILVLTLLIGTVMASVTWMVLHQVRQTLVRQVIDRGEAQVKSLSLNSVDPLLAHAGQDAMGDVNILTLMQLTTDVVQTEAAGGGKRTTIMENLPPWQQQLFDSLDRLNREVQNRLWAGQTIETGDAEYAAIVDKEGRIVSVRTLNSTTEEDLRRVATKEMYVLPPGVQPLSVANRSEGKVFTQGYRSSDGHFYYHFQAPIVARSSANEPPIPIGVVHLGMNQNSILRVERTVAVTIILITGIVLVLGILFMAIFVTFLVKPIGLLVDGVTAIAEGNLDQRIKLNRHDELGDLTDAFNDMAHSLREKELLKGAFSKYVTKSVVDRIMENEGGLKLGGEKKEVSVFFSDIRGFTHMSEQLRPEEVVSLLNEYFTEMVKIIFKYEGTLDKFMGDAIMAVFGAPVDQADHAERAVMAALEMSQKMMELRAKWRMEGKKEVNIGIGINTGEVIVGNLGSNERMEYTAIGDNVNLAQRLESVAEGGQILISSATYEIVKGKVVARMLEPIKLKGKAEKVIPYEVESLRA